MKKNGRELASGKARVTVPLSKHVAANDIYLIKALAIAGNGITLLPPFVCQAEVKQGKLVRVLQAGESAGWDRTSRVDLWHHRGPAPSKTDPEREEFPDVRYPFSWLISPVYFSGEVQRMDHQ